MANSMSASFPSIFVPEEQKDELYSKQFVQAITSRSIMAGYTSRYALFNECVNFYLGLQTGDEFDFLQRAEDGEVLPAKWMDFGKIAPKIDLLIGELIKRSYKIDVKACNKDALSRRMDEKNRLTIEMRFQPIAEELENQFGLPLQQDNGFVPNDHKELDIYMNKTYKETSELVMRAILNYLKKFDGWDYQRIALFRDILIFGACFARNEVIDGMPHVERVDPRYMIFDINAKDDHLSDSTFWGEVRYMSIGEIIKQYPDITPEELRAAYKSYQDFNSNQTYFASLSQDFGFIDQTTRLSIFKVDGGELRILVVKGYWQDYKTLNHKFSEDKYGQTHIKKVPETAKSDKVKPTTLQIWRKGTLIGGRFMRDWGIMENQDRSVDNIATTTPPYIALIPNYFNGVMMSKVNRLRPLQNLKNIVLYNVQLQIATSGGKGFMYDVSQLPKGWDIHTAMKYLRTAKIGFIDSSVEGAGQYNQFKDFDMGISQSVESFLKICQFIDNEMDQVSGVNEARQGVMEGASQTVGVTNSMLVQSNLSTEVYFTLFGQFFSKILNKQAGLAKIAWAGKERFAPIIGDVGINFLKEDVALDLNDYDVFINEVPPAVGDQQMLTQLVMAGLQSGSVSLLQAVKILMEKDIDESIGMLEKDLQDVQDKQEAQQQQELMQEQQQMQMQQQAAQSQNQTKLVQDQMKGQADLQKIFTQGKLDTQQQLLGFKKDLAIKQLDLAIQKTKDAQKAKEKAKKAKK